MKTPWLPLTRTSWLNYSAISDRLRVSPQSSNPHPVRRLSATLNRYGTGGDRVRFQSSPSPKTECYLIRQALNQICQKRFQSSPSPKTECYTLQRYFWLPPLVFQSSPSPKTECYQSEIERWSGHYWVPILTQSEDWVLLLPMNAALIYFKSSNPHPVRRLSATSEMSQNELMQELTKFQSSPSPKTECYKQETEAIKAELKFQSSPSPKTECYFCRWTRL